MKKKGIFSRLSHISALCLFVFSSEAFSAETLLPGYVKVNEANIHYVAAGSGNETIVFLHGFPEFWYMWKAQLNEFSKDYRVVAPDLRGYNLSQKFSDLSSYSVDTVVMDIKGIFDHFAPGKKSILVAHDWGAALSFAFASRYPEYLKSLVIINGPHLNVFLHEYRNNPKQKKASSYIPVFRSSKSEIPLGANTFAGFRKSIFDAFPKAFSPDDQISYLDAWSIPGALSGGLNYYRALEVLDPANNQELAPQYVKVPTLVIWGTLDQTLVYENVMGMRKYVSNMMVKDVTDAGHWVVQEKPALINKMLRDYLSANP